VSGAAPVQARVQLLPTRPESSLATHFHGDGGDHGPDHFHDLDDHVGEAGHSHAPVEMAFADADLLDRLGVREKGVVEVRTARDRRHLTRAAADADLRGTGTIRLARAALHALKCGVDDHVWLHVGRVQACRRLILEPLAPLSQSLQAYEAELSAELTGRGQLVQAGMLVAVKLADFRRDVFFRAVTVAPEQAYVTDQTRLVLRTSLLPPGASANLVSFDDVGGLAAEIAQLRELVEGPLRYPEVYDQLGIDAPRGILLHGPPGVGKTHLARAVSNEIGAHFLYVNGPEVLSSVQGGTEANLRAIFEEAMESAPSVVLVDEIDAIAPARRDTSHIDARMGTQLLSLLDGLVSMADVILLATTNRPEALDPALRRPGRLDREIFIGPPEAAGRLQILRIHSRAMPLTPQAQAYVVELAQATHGYTGADLKDLVREAGLQALRRQVGAGLADLDPDTKRLADPHVDARDLRYALSRTTPSALREATTGGPAVRWSDIAGLDEEIRYLREAIEMPLRHPEAFADVGLNPSAGVLLYGEPGTGKTMLAHAASHESGANLITVNGPEVFSKWLGESEQAIRDAFQLARQSAPSVVVLDQIDAMAPRRTGEQSNPAAERVVNQLLIEIDGIRTGGQISVIGVTNRPDLVDAALLRPGRLGVRLRVGLPDAEARERILALHLPASDADLRAQLARAAQSTEGCSGADLVAIADAARMYALRDAGFARHSPITAAHLERAVDQQHQHAGPVGAGIPPLSRMEPT
jgi:transitional endoplasmic reticulum ATPase